MTRRDDTTDSVTAAIQAAIDVGIWLPADRYTFATPLVAGLKGISGMFRNETLLNYTGEPTDEGAVRFKTQSYGAKVADFHLTGQNKGTGIRVCDFTAEPVGSQFAGQVWDRVRIEHFQTGLWIGDQATKRAGDSFTLNGLETWGCETGVRLEQWNTLCVVFNNLQTTKSRVGLDMGQSGSVVVNGGGGSECDVLYEVGAGTNYTITGARSEVCRRFLRAAGWAGTTTVNVNNCETTGQKDLTDWDGIDIEVVGGNSLVMTGGTLRGCVSYAGRENKFGYGSITLIGVRTFAPELFRCVKGTRVGWNFINCARVDENGFVVERINGSGNVWK